LIYFPCALIHWFSVVGDTPDEDTGMWVVKPDYLPGQKPFLEVIHVDSILRGAHFIRKTYILLYRAFSCFFMLLVLFEGKKVTL